MNFKLNARALAWIAALLVIALLSAFVLAGKVSSPEFHKESIEYLDGKEDTVMTLMAASTAASAMITLMPGDAGTPIANKLADISTYFLIALCAVYLEKYLLTLMGLATFKIIVPIACAIGAAGVALCNRTVKAAALKIAIFGIALFLVVPASVEVSKIIENTYGFNIEETSEYVEELTDEAVTSEAIEDAKEKGGAKSVLDIINGWAEGLANGVTGAVESVTNSVNSKVKTMENLLNSVIEKLAVVLVTSCIIPILVLLLFVWLIKMIFGMNYLPAQMGKGGSFLPMPKRDE